MREYTLPFSLFEGVRYTSEKGNYTDRDHTVFSVHANLKSIRILGAGICGEIRNLNKRHPHGWALPIAQNASINTVLNAWSENYEVICIIPRWDQKNRQKILKVFVFESPDDLRQNQAKLVFGLKNWFYIYDSQRLNTQLAGFEINLSEDKKDEIQAQDSSSKDDEEENLSYESFEEDEQVEEETPAQSLSSTGEQLENILGSLLPTNITNSVFEQKLNLIKKNPDVLVKVMFSMSSEKGKALFFYSNKKASVECDFFNKDAVETLDFIRAYQYCNVICKSANNVEAFEEERENKKFAINYYKNFNWQPNFFGSTQTTTGNSEPLAMNQNDLGNASNAGNINNVTQNASTPTLQKKT